MLRLLGSIKEKLVAIAIDLTLQQIRNDCLPSRSLSEIDVPSQCVTTDRTAIDRISCKAGPKAAPRKMTVVMLIPSSDVTSIIQEFSRFYRSVLASCGQGIFKNVMRVMLIPSSDVTSIIQRLSHFCRSASCGQGIIQEVGITLQQTCLLFDFCYCCRRRSIGFIYKRVKLTCGLNKKVPAVHVLSIDFCRQSKTRRLPRRMLFTFTAASKLNRLLVCIPFSFHGNIFISMEMFL